MFTNVLVGIDERSRGRDAVALAERLVEPGGELSFAHAHTDFAFPAGLREVAEERGADLLVLGSSRESPRGRVSLREEASRAINGAPCAVAVAPLGYVELGTPITQIGIAYNGSEESLDALDVGRELAAELGAATSAFQALSPGGLSGGRGPSVDADAVSRELEVGARERLCRDTGMNAYASVGDPIGELSIFSASVDLLIIGSRDLGAGGRLAHGSTTLGLLGHARSPMLMLTRASRARRARLITTVPAAVATAVAAVI